MAVAEPDTHPDKVNDFGLRLNSGLIIPVVNKQIVKKVAVSTDNTSGVLVFDDATGKYLTFPSDHNPFGKTLKVSDIILGGDTDASAITYGTAGIETTNYYRNYVNNNGNIIKIKRDNTKRHILPVKFYWKFDSSGKTCWEHVHINNLFGYSDIRMYFNGTDFYDNGNTRISGSVWYLELYWKKSEEKYYLI